MLYNKEMLEKIKSLFNIEEGEAPRIAVSWSMTFLMRFGFVIGWTILIAMFLTRVGIGYLPALFLGNALLVMLGTFIYRPLLSRVRREVLIAFTVLTACIFLISSVFFVQDQSPLFFALLLGSESVLLAQLAILLSLFNEEMFNATESPRVFPIIESAETIGAIAAGALLTTFAQNLASYKFILIWALSLFVIVPIVLSFNPSNMLKDEEEKEIKKEKRSLRDSIKVVKRTPFLKGMMLVILLNWAIMNVIEFQYTKAIQQDIYSVQEESIFMEGDDGIKLASEDLSLEESYEREITQKLGFFHLIFNTGALLVQLVLASRIITRLGITSSLLLHPVITFLNLIALTFRFGFVSAAITRGSYELSQSIFKSSYDSSYYAIPHDKREDVKEVMQGLMKPLGAILGTLLIIVIATKLGGIKQSLALNLCLIAMSIIMSILILKMRKKYSLMSEQNLSSKFDLHTRINAVEILAQKGHNKLTPALSKLLKREKEAPKLKIQILQTLGQRQEASSIPDILECLKDKDPKIRKAALESLSKLDKFMEEDKKNAFTRHEIIHKLRAFLEKEKDDKLIEQAIECLYYYSASDASQFIIKAIEKENEHTASFIRALKQFEDPGLKKFLESYLESKNPELKAASITALWHFEDIQKQLKHHLRQMLESKKKRTRNIAEALKIELEIEEL